MKQTIAMAAAGAKALIPDLDQSQRTTAGVKSI